MFCSLHLVDKTMNNHVRRQAAADAIVASYTDLGGRGGDMVVSKGYEIVSPDPLESPNNVYVDVKITIVDMTSQQDDNTAEPVARRLKDLDPWIAQEDAVDDDVDDKNKFKRFVTLEDDNARVDLDPCYERLNEFYRRISLFKLASFIANEYESNNNSIVDALFEDPVELTEENSLLSLSSRAKFTKESLVNWFFKLDTYSKCITLVEAFTHRLRSEETCPVRIDIYDMYCSVFSRINRLVRVKPIDKSDTKTQIRELTVLEDVKMTSVSGVIDKFLSFSCTGNSSSVGGIRRRPGGPGSTLLYGSIEDAASVMGPSESEAVSNILNSILPGCGRTGDYSALKRRRRAITNGGAGAEEPYEEDVSFFTVINGYSNNGRAIAPFSVAIRPSPILMTREEGASPNSLYNQLLYPVYSDESPEDVLFFAKPKKSAIATLFLPGLFRFKDKQYLTGVCKELTHRINDASVVWRYTLADYTPISSAVEGMHTSKAARSIENETDFIEFMRSGNSKGPALLPLSF